MTLLAEAFRTVKESKSPLSFQVEGGDGWSQWDRYLAIDGEKAYHIGNICGTCRYFFERLAGANKSVNPEHVANMLNTGVSSLSQDILHGIEKIMPNGEYRVLLLRISPKRTFPGDENDYFTHEQVALWGIDSFWDFPHHPRTEYYRLSTTLLKEGRGLFEFLIPMFPVHWLKEERVMEFREDIRLGIVPTAVAVSLLDVKGPAVWEGEDPEIVEHYCLAHYLVDGHHKVFAAAISNQPITLISFLAEDFGISSPSDILDVVNALKAV